MSPWRARGRRGLVASGRPGPSPPRWWSLLGGTHVATTDFGPPVTDRVSAAVAALPADAGLAVDGRAVGWAQWAHRDRRPLRDLRAEVYSVPVATGLRGLPGGAARLAGLRRGAGHHRRARRPRAPPRPGPVGRAGVDLGGRGPRLPPVGAPVSTSATRRARGHPDVVGAAVAALLATLVAVLSLRVWEWRPGVPPSLVGDSPVVLTQVDDILVNGWFWSNEAVGFPLGQNASFFPELNVIHVLGVKALGLLGGDAATVGALYFFLGYPLVAVTTYLLARSERLARPASVVVAVLFAAAPYHAERFEHLWLASYWTLPLGLWVVLAVARGRTPFDPGRSGGRRRLVLTLLALTLVGLSGAYYAGFTLILLAAALVLRAGAGRPPGWWRGGLASMAWLGAVAALPLVAAKVGMSGTTLTGPRPATRSPLESERYAGRVIDLLLPWEGHRLEPLAALTQAYTAAGRPVTETLALGLVGVAGTRRPRAHRPAGAGHGTTGARPAAAVGRALDRRPWRSTRSAAWAASSRSSPRPSCAPGRASPSSSCCSALLAVGSLAEPPPPRRPGRRAPRARPRRRRARPDEPGAGAPVRRHRGPARRHPLLHRSAGGRHGAGVRGAPAAGHALPRGLPARGVRRQRPAPAAPDDPSARVEPRRHERHPGRATGPSGSTSPTRGAGRRAPGRRVLRGRGRHRGRGPDRTRGGGADLDLSGSRWPARPTVASSPGRCPSRAPRRTPTVNACSARCSSGSQRGPSRWTTRTSSRRAGPGRGSRRRTCRARPCDGIEVTMDVTALGADQRDVVVRDGDAGGRAGDRRRRPGHAPELRRRRPRGLPPARPSRWTATPSATTADNSVSARFENLRVALSGPERVVSLHDQARTRAVFP